MTAPPTGVLLAGGLSSRMGEPKALLDIDGKPLLTHVARAVVAHCPHLVLSVGTMDQAPPEVVERLRAATDDAAPASVRVAHDDVAEQGPVGALAAALPHASTAWAFVTACDAPFLHASLISGLARYATEDADVVLPVWNERPEPLLAFYRTATMAPHFQAQLTSGGGSPVARLDRVRVVRIDTPRLLELDPDGSSFVNVNDRDDYARALARARRDA